MDFDELTEYDKLNFIVDALSTQPEMIDDVLRQIDKKLVEKNNVYNLAKITTKNYMDDLQKGFNNPENQSPGDQVLSAITHACQFNRLLPKWVRWAYLCGIIKYNGYEEKTLSDALKLGKRRNFDSRKKAERYKYLAWQEVISLHRKGEPICRETFELAGCKLGLTGALVEKYYYLVIKNI